MIRQVKVHKLTGIKNSSHFLQKNGEIMIIQELNYQKTREY